MASSPGSQSRGLLISGRYRIVRKLGSGSMGTVYHVHDEGTQRPAALKLLRTERMDRDGLEQLQREFRAIVSLHHPQIATAYDFGYTGELLPYYTRELIEGSPLAPGPLRGAGESSARASLEPFFDLLAALQYLHEHEILHLDIHAGNLIVARDTSRGSVLIDFGLLRPLREAAAHPLLSSRSRLAPELVADEPVGPSTDLYGVGRLLLYRLTGSAEGEARLPAELPGWGPRRTLELERIVDKAVQREPSRRFQSAREFREALAAVLGDSNETRSPAEPGDAIAGRTAELAAIEEALRQGTEGRCALVWLTGPEGIGKSRLLREARQRAQLRGLLAAHVTFIGEAGARPALVAALRSTLGARRSASTWIHLLDPGHGGSSVERARRAAAAYFEEEASPLVILLDDLDRCDRSSRILAAALLAECRRREAGGETGRGLVILVASAGAPGSWLGRTSARHNVRRLGPLRPGEASALLARLLRPLEAPRPLVSRLAREARGQPLRLRRLARALREEWKGSGSIPRDAETPAALREASGSTPSPRRARATADLRILATLALLERPAGSEELAVAAGLPPAAVQSALRRVLEDEVVTERRRGGVRRYHVASPAEAARLRRSLSTREARLVHGRMIAHLSRAAPGDVSALEPLARHLLAVRRWKQGRAVALRAADLLRRRGDPDAAVAILSAAAAVETDAKWRLHLCEEMSALHEQAGDHREGLACLGPALRGKLGALGRRESVRVRRRLGVHHHRAGSAEKALALFREALALADLDRDVEELVFIGSELAELHTLRGEYTEAEEACRRALGLLSKVSRASHELRSRMEVTLRASLGHLELRRMALDRAREELEAAARLARSHGTTGLQALILNNLGIVHNQQNNFAGARACFRKAERLLERSGERRGIISIACNLASIAAKTGDIAAAAEHVERATRLLARYPAPRLEHQVILTRGMAAHFAGEATAAIDAWQESIPHGRGLADAQFVGFTEAYLAEARLACGHYDEAARGCRRLAAASRDAGPAVLHRMAQARLYVVESLLGRPRAARTAREALDRMPRTGVALLEAWNDLFTALGHRLHGSAAAPASSDDAPRIEALLESALRTFRRLRVPVGARLAQVGLLESAVASGAGQRIRAALRRVEAGGESTHRLLAVLEPLARAEACFALGELERAEEALGMAACAIVGVPFLELDGRIELLRARLADRQGDRESARRHVQRSLQTRELLAHAVPGRDRAAFLEHPRFAALLGLVSRLEKPRPTPLAAHAPAAVGSIRHGMVGSSPAMKAVQQTIERLRDQELPVLITGETGTGKELVARAIHETGPRRRGPFLALHCASLPAELFESELLGHEAGAFTGAEEPREGILEHLAGGTLLLDEVGGLSLPVQAKLLRLLDTRRVRRLGGLDERPVDVRFLAASSTDLQAGTDAGTFRADLFFRLRGAEIHLPPLRARREDIPLLTRHFLAMHARRLERPAPLLGSAALRLLEAHDWPGNVRELETLLVRALITGSPGSALDAEAVRQLLPRPRTVSVFDEDAFAGRDLKQLRKELERVYLSRLFRDTAGDIAKMTRALGVKASRVYAWFREVGLDIAALRRER